MDGRFVKYRDPVIMKKILFVSDFFINHLNGGAEHNDKVLIKHLANKYDVTLILSHEMAPESVFGYDLIIVSNFAFLSQEVKAKLEEVRYVIYEHDHKYAKNRDPSRYPDFLIPADKITNVSFYENAACVVVLSKICKDILIKNIPTANVHSIGCSLWSKEAFRVIKSLIGVKKEFDCCILKSGNPVKATAQTLSYCEGQKINPILLSEMDYDSFLLKMSKCKRFLFLPAVLETFSRVCAEAKMLNLSLTTIPKKLGFASEEIFDLSGLELIEALEERTRKALAYFEKLVDA